jgi:serine/threonine protein kinase
MLDDAMAPIPAGMNGECPSHSVLARRMTAAPDETDGVAAACSKKRTVGRFEIGPVIARGGTGTVYRGLDGRTLRRVAIKRLKADLHVDGLDESRLRFERESRILLSLDHPNVIKVVDALVADGEYYIIMEYIPGGSLRQRLQLDPPLARPHVLRLALELCDALSFVHRSGIVHRDIKPENVLLADDGSPRLTDFGLSRNLEQMLTRSDALSGTFAYMSPEVLWGSRADARADIWALGVMLFEMLTGVRPFPGTHPAPLLTAILHREPMKLQTLRPDLPGPLVDLIEHLLQKDPGQRPSEVRQVGAALQHILSESPPDRPEPRSASSGVPSSELREDPHGPIDVRQGVGVSER